MPTPAKLCEFCEGPKAVTTHEIDGVMVTVCAYCAQQFIGGHLESFTPIGRLDGHEQAPQPDGRGYADCEHCGGQVIWVRTKSSEHEIALDGEFCIGDQVRSYRRWRLLPGHRAAKWPSKTSPDRCYILHSDVCGALPKAPSLRLQDCPTDGIHDSLWSRHRTRLERLRANRPRER